MTAGPSDFLPVVRALCLEAGKAVMALRGGPLEKSRKPDNSLVTNAYHSANDILRRGLRAAFPGHAILSEETGFEGPPGASHTWLLDPLDGTRAYAGGRAGFSVMVGLIVDGRPVAGVVYDPLDDRLYEAAAAGAFQTRAGSRAPLRVSRRDDLSTMSVITSTGFPDKIKAGLQRDLPGPWLPSINSVGVKVGWVARGDADIYLNHHKVHLWDTAGPKPSWRRPAGRSPSGPALRWPARPLPRLKPTPGPDPRHQRSPPHRGPQKSSHHGLAHCFWNTIPELSSPSVSSF